MKLQLIPDWRLAYRFMSIQAAALLALLSGIQGEVLPIMKPLFPPDKWPWISGLIALAIVVLRLIAQDGLRMDASAQGATEPAGQRMPAGRLERYLGLALLLAVFPAVLFLIALLRWLVN